MTELIKVSTKNYKKSGKVDIDGNIWEVKLPGAATEMKLMQAQRRLSILEKKVKSGEATDEDLDRYDAFEKVAYDTFRGMFKDKTEDNSEVNKWIDETPMGIIVLAFESIKEQANGEESS